MLEKEHPAHPGNVPSFLTVSELAIRLGVTRNWVYNHADSLGAVHLGKYIRFSWSKVLEILGEKP
jgi:hypothetical protein